MPSVYHPGISGNRQTEVTWGERHITPLPLYKLVFGNLNRMPMLAKTLKHDNRLGDERKKLEQRAIQAIKGLPCFEGE